MTVQTKDLWGLVLDRQWIDPHELADAIEDQVRRGDLDFRTRLLIRDSLDGLRAYWGEERLAAWVAASPAGREIERICREDFSGEFGFPFLKGSIVEPTHPDKIRQFFEELGQHVRRPVRLHVGGSVALILPGYLSRRTEDIDVVDELPAEIRSQQNLLNDLAGRYRLALTHFQSHYLPMGWEQRVHSLAPFGQVQVSLIDVYDVVLSKLFSGRTKDRDDLRALVPQLDKETLVRKLKESTASMLAAPDLRQKAENNWTILFGEALPS
jgi:Nucleotidyltransferase of unknown function (DUF6036)